MANENLPVNIDLSEEWKEADGEGSKKESSFDAKNYLNVRLENGEAEKKIKIRLLPMDAKGGSPFIHVHFHNVEVNKDLVKPGQKPFKSFLCLDEKKNPTIDHARFGTRCPFCEANKDAYAKSLEEGLTAEQKERYQDLSIANLSKEAIIVRCIERGKEEEGVKFWKFNLKFDKTDPYHKILDLAKERAREGEEAGTPINILDLYNGRDLNLTIHKGNTGNQTVIDIIESGVSTPLSKDPELINKWLNDTKKWQDVFTAKPYEYLYLISQGKVPWFDRSINKWVDKEEYEAQHSDEKKEAEDKADEEIKKSYNNLTTSSVATSETQVIEDVATEDEDDLPF